MDFEKRNGVFLVFDQIAITKLGSAQLTAHGLSHTLLLTSVLAKALSPRKINLDVGMNILAPSRPWLFIFLGKGCRSYHFLLHLVKRNCSLLLGRRNS